LTQLQTELRRDATPSETNSPNGLGGRRSLFVDTPSPSSLSASASGYKRTDDPSQPLSATEEPVYKLLVDFGKQFTAVSIAQTSRTLAEARLKQATKEYDNMKPHFSPSFPTIEADKTKAKLSAENHLKKCEVELAARIDQQEHSTQNLTALFAQQISNAASEAAKKAVETVVADYVPRSAHETLHKRFESDIGELRDKLRNYQNPSNTSVKDEVERMKSDLSTKASDQDVKKMEADITSQLQLKADKQDIGHLRDYLLSRMLFKADNEEITKGMSLIQSKAGREDLASVQTKLQEQMTSLKSPQTPTPAFQLPNAFSSMSGAHGPNGLSGTINGSPDPDRGGTQLPQGGLIGEVLEIQQRLKAIDQKHESLTFVCRALQRQYDNLTTEEVVQLMVDQMSSMYPDAKNCQKAIYELRHKYRALETELNGVKNTAQRSLANSQGACTLALTKSHQTAPNASEAAEGAQMGGGANDMTRLRVEIEQCKQRLANTEEALLKTAHAQFTQEDSVESAKTEDLARQKAELKAEIGDVTTKIAELGQKVDRSLTAANAEMLQAHKVVQKLMVKVAGHESKIRALEETRT